MLTYDPANNESLLHILWRYQGRMDNITLLCLEYLLDIIEADNFVAEFFSQLPGCTYQYARYTDWIKPYLQNQLAKAN